jgi:hypothetical protein
LVSSYSCEVLCTILGRAQHTRNPGKLKPHPTQSPPSVQRLVSDLFVFIRIRFPLAPPRFVCVSVYFQFHFISAHFVFVSTRIMFVVSIRFTFAFFRAVISIRFEFALVLVRYAFGLVCAVSFSERGFLNQLACVEFLFLCRWILALT